MRIHHVFLVVTLVVALPLAAQSNDAGIWYSSAKLGSTDGSGGRVSFSNAHGAGASFNHFWGSSPLSTEVTIGFLRGHGGIDVGGVRALNFDRTRITPITADMQWHFFRQTMISPYVGAGLAYVTMNDIKGNDLDLAGIGPIKVDKKVTWNAGAGVTLNISRVFAIAADAKYIKYEPTGKTAITSAKLKLDPKQFGIGLKVRF